MMKKKEFLIPDSSTDLNEEISSLLKNLGFKYIMTGKAYLAARFKKHKLGRRISSNFARVIIENLRQEVNRKNSISSINPPKRDFDFTVSDFVDYVFCPYKASLKFKGAVAPRTKDASEGEALHRNEEFLEHLEVIRKNRQSFWGRVTDVISSEFSRNYKNFIANNLLDSEIVYSSEKPQDLLKSGNLRGRPDYIFNTWKGNMLLELKYSNSQDDVLYNTYKIQMHCYSLLAERNSIPLHNAFILKFPRQKKKLVYPKIHPWKIDLDQAKREVSRINRELTKLVKDKGLSRVYPLELKKCVKCSYRYFCQRLLKAKLA